MKINVLAVTLTALIGSLAAGAAQTGTGDSIVATSIPAPATNPATVTTVTITTSNSAPAETPAAVVTNAPAVVEAPVVAPAPVVAAAPVAAPAPATVVVAVVETNAAPAPAPAPAAAAPMAVTPVTAHDTSGVIPLIVMDEVPLTDAIKNLARQANLNYMLDPKINYNAPDAQGNIKPQPTVSLRWENISADQALYAVLNNYNLTIVDDPKTHIARITIKDPAAAEPIVTKIIQLKYSDPTNILTSVMNVLLDKRSKAIADVRTSQLVVVATDKEMVDVDTLIARLDTPTKQVLIEAKLVEITKNPTTTKGIDWSGTLQAQHLSFGNGALLAVTPQPTLGTSSNANSLLATVLGGGGVPGIQYNTQNGFNPSPFFLNADGVSAVLSFLNTEADAKVLSTPRAVTLDNQEAVLSVVTAVPIFNTTAGTQGSPGGSQVTYTNLGTILKVTPRISANDTIALKVIPEVSDVSATITKTVSGEENQADEYEIRRIETRVVIPSGHTLVMGGLVNDSSTKGNTKVPFMGDIPVLGYLFRQESKTQNKQNLIIFVTPTIVRDDDYAPDHSTFLKTKATVGKSESFGAWDRGNPQDWSKLFNSKKDKPGATNSDEMDLN